MPQPAPYAPSFSFTEHKADVPAMPLLAPKLDGELAALANTLLGVLTNLARIQRDDGQLATGTINAEALTPDAIAAFIAAAPTWLQGIQGDKGDKGDPGQDGSGVVNGTKGDVTVTNAGQPDESWDVPGLDAIADREPAIAATTAADYYRGDKTFQPLDKAAVGLGSVDDTADADKPVSTAQAAAINSVATSIGQTAATAGRVIVAADAGKTIPASGTMSIPDDTTWNAPVGTFIEIYNTSGAAITVQLAGGSDDTLRLVGTASIGARTLNSYGLGWLRKVGPGYWLFGGAGAN